MSLCFQRKNLEQSQGTQRKLRFWGREEGPNVVNRIVAAVTLCSALLGVAYALREFRKKRGNARYLLARSVVLAVLAAVPLTADRPELLWWMTVGMLGIQALDAWIGVLERSLPRTVGPAVMAVLHGICLVFLFVANSRV